MSSHVFDFFIYEFLQIIKFNLGLFSRIILQAVTSEGQTVVFRGGPISKIETNGANSALPFMQANHSM